MSYLERLGIELRVGAGISAKELEEWPTEELKSGLEQRLARLLCSTDGPEEYNPDLNLSNYLHFLKVYSRDRSSDPYDRGYNYNLMDRAGQISGWEEKYKINRILTILYSPVQEIEGIRERQNLLRRYISSRLGEEDRDLTELTNDLMRNHYSLYSNLPEDLDRIDLSKIAAPFVKTVESLVIFRDRFVSDSQLSYFAKRIDDIFKNNPITKIAVLLEQGGAVIMGTDRRATKADMTAKADRRLEREREERRGNFWGYRKENEDESRPDGYEFWLARSEPIGKGIFDLGRFKPGEGAKMRDYPNQKKDIVQMVNFAYDSSVLVYILASMQYQAEIYNRRKKLGLPVCIPELNDEGRFRVKNGHPIATNLEEEPIPINLSYDRTHRKFIIGGAHSGGKTELLKNIGLYHLVGVGGGIWPAEEGEVPLTRNIITSLRKGHEESKGSLESELKNAMKIAKDMGERDVALIDEFLDTTKPELARHISYPLLVGEEGLCIGFAKSPGTVYIVDHRAPILREDMGFEFMYPVLVRKKATELAKKIRARLRRDSESTTDLDFFSSLNRRTVLIPTHTFAVGKPSPKEVQKHALQMWQRVMWNISHREEGFYSHRRNYETYSSEVDDVPRAGTDPKRNYVIWQVPGKIGGLWVNNPEANRGRGQDEEEPRIESEEESSRPWDDDEIVTDDGNPITDEKSDSEPTLERQEPAQEYHEEGDSDNLPF